MGRHRLTSRPWIGVGIGVLSVVVLTLAVSPFRDHLSRAIPALLLVLPVVAAGVLGGRAAAVATAVVATVALNIGFIPPVGSARVAVPDDAVALVVFGLVALTVGTLVALEEDRRRAAEQRAEEINAMHARFQALVAEREHLRQEADRVAVMEQVDVQRAALLRSVSHDLRTPLSSIRAVASDLRSGEVHSDAVRHELLGLVCVQAERLDRIVANLLSLSRIEAGAFQPDRQAVDLEELVREVTSRLQPLFDDDAIRVDCHLGRDLPLVDVDYVQIDQVLSNLLENAARFSPPGGAVHVHAVAGAGAGAGAGPVGRPSGNGSTGCVEVSVSDEGPGIPPPDLARIFEPFRAGRAAQDSVSGVGLALCKAIVEAHGGMITAANNPAGGARLCFTLPVRHG
ncbi:MAG TPA: ATP-binding protein [Acidimicrobiales bacterium]|jgi:two-component system sensor histidine kinase KdpD|nr:ATP-binding protein [Acidimicrobiales bacterium]